MGAFDFSGSVDQPIYVAWYCILAGIVLVPCGLFLYCVPYRRWRRDRVLDRAERDEEQESARRRRAETDLEVSRIEANVRVFSEILQKRRVKMLRRSMKRCTEVRVFSRGRGDEPRGLFPVILVPHTPIHLEISLLPSLSCRLSLKMIWPLSSPMTRAMSRTTKQMSRRDLSKTTVGGIERRDEAARKSNWGSPRGAAFVWRGSPWGMR